MASVQGLPTGRRVQYAERGMHDDLPIDVWHRTLKTSSAILPGGADSESVGRKPEHPTTDTSIAPVQAMRARRFMTTLRKKRSLFSGRRQSDFLFCEVERNVHLVMRTVHLDDAPARHAGT